jgi:hypothetical protein
MIRLMPNDPKAFLILFFKLQVVDSVKAPLLLLLASETKKFFFVLTGLVPIEVPVFVRELVPVEYKY